MGEVIKFRARLTAYDIDAATTFGKPLREYAERLAIVKFQTRKMMRAQLERKEKECASSQSPSAAGRPA